jgi:type I restriction enzyme S subunit
MSAKLETPAPPGRKKIAQGKEQGGSGVPPLNQPKQQRRDASATLGHESQNTSSPEGAKEGGELPLGWRRVAVKDMADSIQYGHTASAIERKDGPRFLRITDIQDGRVNWSAVPSCDIPKEDIPKYRLSSGDLVFARTGATTGKSFLIGDCPEAVFASYLIRVRVSADVDSRYLSAFFQSPDYWRQIEGGKRGIGQPNVNGTVLGEVQFPVAPLPEQHRIVAEIEKQFTRLEAGVAALRRVQANLKRYRAAVLKAACEGRLVPTEAELFKVAAASRRSPAGKQSRDGSATFETGEALLTRILTERRQTWQGRGQYKEPAAPDTAKLPPLPEGWAWATAQQLNLSNRPCAYGVLQPGDDIPDGVPFVRVGDINNGSVALSNLKRISPAIADQYPRTRLRGGELAITLVGAIGRTAIIPESLAGGNTARAVGIIPLTKETNPHWIEIWFRNPAKTAEMDSKSHEVARKTLNLEDVRVASVALPPLAEQTRIVAEVERRLSVVEELEAVVSANLQRATRLRQSILQKAFSGRLATADAFG